MTQALSALLANLEAATGPSRELDAEIATVIFGRPRASGNVGEPQVLHWWDRAVGFAVAPRYTESLDAARTLLPEGWFALIDTRGRADVRYAPIDQSGYRREVADAATPALALCIAALRARLAGRHK